MSRSPKAVGLLALLLSSACFGTSGSFAKALLVTGWSSGAIVTLRIGGAALVLLPFALISLRGRWAAVRAELPVVAAYGLIAVAGCQVAYFYAVQRLTVGVALLLEYLGVVLVVAWVALRSRRLPNAVTALGAALALIGLVVVLDLTSAERPDLVGVLWGLAAAVGLAVFYTVAARPSQLPPVGLAGLGMAFGAVALLVLGGLRLLPLSASTDDLRLAVAVLPWWAGILELAVVAAALAYFVGVFGARRLGSTISSFVGLTEVLFAILFAWILLGELPGWMQLAGGVLILVGVVAVRIGETRSAAAPATADLAEVAVPAGAR